MKPKSLFPILLLGLAPAVLAVRGADEPAALPPVRFNTAFESGSIGLIEKLGENEFRLNV